VDIDEAVWRFRANLAVVVVGLVVGLVVAGGFGLSRAASYRASARLVVGGKDPRSLSDAKVVADTARAIVESEARVAAALKAAGANRDAHQFAQNNVDITPVGSSAVLELSVVDRDPAVAAAVSNSLAAALIQTRKELADRRFADVLGQLDQRIAAAAKAVEQGALAVQKSAGQRGLSPAVQTYREAVHRLGQLETDRRRVFEEKASVPSPSLIERAAVPTAAEASRMVPDLVLGALLGLVLGVGIAAIRETLRPTVAGDRAIARLLGVPSVGTLSGPPSIADDASLRAVGARLRLAAEAAGIRKLALTSVDGPTDLDAFAKRLSAVIDGDEQGSYMASRDTGISWEVFSTEGEGLRALRESPSAVGLVLVAPSVFKRRDLDSVMDLRLMTGWQLFGCVMYRRPRWPRRRHRRVVPGATQSLREPVNSRWETVPPGAREPANPESISLDEPAQGSILLDATPSAAAIGRTSTPSPEALPPSAAAAPGAVNTRVTEMAKSSGDEPAAERVAGPEGSLHWAPWGWK